MKHSLTILALAFALSSFAQAGDLQTDLIANEKALWTAFAKKDAEAFKTHLAPDVVNIEAGLAPMIGIDAYLKRVNSGNCELHSVDMQDVKMTRLSADVVALSFIAASNMVCDGKREPPKLAVTSIWQQQGGKWVNRIYHSSPIG